MLSFLLLYQIENFSSLWQWFFLLQDFSVAVIYLYFRSVLSLTSRSLSFPCRGWKAKVMLMSHPGTCSSSFFWMLALPSMVVSITNCFVTSYTFNSLKHNSFTYLLTILQFGQGSSKTASLCCTWHQLRQAQLGLEEQLPSGLFTGLATQLSWLGTQLSLWSHGFNSPPCVLPWASPPHGVCTPRG